MNNLYNVDILEGLSKIEDNSIDCIITSPPYNKFGLNKFKHRKIGYDIYSDDIPEDEYQINQVKVLDEFFRIIKPKGSIFYNHKNRRVNKTEHSPLEWIIKSKLNLYQTIIWNRNQSPNISNTFLLPTYELIFWMTKTNETPRVYRNRLDSIKDIWNISPSRSKVHPATFPEKLVENCILLTTNEGDVILDGYAGIGTTLKVSKKLNRQYIGFEISKNYIDEYKKNQ